MSPSEAVTAVKKIRWNWFLVLLLWGGVVALYPAAVFVADSWHFYPEDPINWTMVWHMSAPLFLAGCYGGWKKYKAYLELPPGIEALIQIQKVTTVSSTGKADDPNPVVTTKVQETTTTVQVPSAEEPKKP